MQKMSPSIQLKTTNKNTPELAPLINNRTLHTNKENIIKRIIKSIRRFIFGIKPEFKERYLSFQSEYNRQIFVDNSVHNTKYNIFTLIPYTLLDQFRYFFNLFYLLVSLAQIVPSLQVGPVFTYLAPLGFVMSVTITKEAIDDIKRYFRDKEINNTLYSKFTEKGFVKVTAANIKVGDIIIINANERAPADLIFIKTTNLTGSTFIKTDQLDGETDWKLRRAIHTTQNLTNLKDIFSLSASIQIEAPKKDIYDFNGVITLYNDLHNIQTSNEITKTFTTEDTSINSSSINSPYLEALSLENTFWANTVITSGTVYAMAIYTGEETRTKMNSSSPRAKIGIFDKELNYLSKVLFFLLLIISFILLSFRGFISNWFITYLRYILLVSNIIPISLRVNLEMAKILYSVSIMRDKEIQDTIVRSSKIPEELGRVDYLLTDKTGTLTQNDMSWKRLHVGRAVYSMDDINKLRDIIFKYYDNHLRELTNKQELSLESDNISKNIQFNKHDNKQKFHIHTLKHEIIITTHAITALSLCHNVYPVHEDGKISYQASSPDEIALVNFADLAGIKLIERDENHIHTVASFGELKIDLKYKILNCFPFTSELKRMGIIVQEMDTKSIYFIVKGAESTLIPFLQPRGSNWVKEEADNFARQGLRTLVIAWKELTEMQYKSFQKRYKEAMTAMVGRNSKMNYEINKLEKDLTLLGLTGVEDKLFNNVGETLELFRNGGIRLWMLTGDKVETAMCVAVSTGLKSRLHNTFILTKDEINNFDDAKVYIQRYAMCPSDTILVVDGYTLEIFNLYMAERFIQVAAEAPAVICCRCSPTQKAQVVKNIKKFIKKRTCAVGDGGNDVSMIQAADVGIGIVGKEGKQASLAADFSIPHFACLQNLLLWHGRNAYQRSCKLAQFVIHRGLIISVIQSLFTALFSFVPIAIFQGWLVVGYSTYYTMAPVFSLVLDVELPKSVVSLYPELYRELKKGRNMSIKTFFEWVWISLYQGAIIILLSLALFKDTVMHITDIAFSSLILSELLNVITEIHTWHPLMIASEICSVIIYIYSIFILRDYFETMFVLSKEFWWKMSVITLISWFPIYLLKAFVKRFSPSHTAKLVPD